MEKKILFSRSYQVAFKDKVYYYIWSLIWLDTETEETTKQHEVITNFMSTDPDKRKVLHSGTYKECYDFIVKQVI